MYSVCTCTTLQRRVMLPQGSPFTFGAFGTIYFKSENEKETEKRKEADMRCTEPPFSLYVGTYISFRWAVRPQDTVQGSSSCARIVGYGAPTRDMGLGAGVQVLGKARGPVVAGQEEPRGVIGFPEPESTLAADAL